MYSGIHGITLNKTSSCRCSPLRVLRLVLWCLWLGATTSLSLAQGGTKRRWTIICDMVNQLGLQHHRTYVGGEMQRLVISAL